MHPTELLSLSRVTRYQHFMWHPLAKKRDHMNKLWLVGIAGVAAFLYYKTHAPIRAPLEVAEPATAVSAPSTTPSATPSATPSTATFRCEGKQRCSQMTSCDEARFYLRNCPAVKIDGDHDGIPCETPPLQCT